MAAYSAVTVFRQTLEQLLDSEQFPPHVSKSQITPLHENVCSLQSSLDKIPFVPKLKREKMKDLQSRIREAIYAAQDEVDYWVRGHSPHEKTMKKLEDDIQLVEKDAADMERETRFDLKAQDLGLESDAQPLFSFSGNDKIVGQEEDFKNVLEKLVDEYDKINLEVIPITGLPGIGKTTLARSIYDDEGIRHNFRIRAWVTVSQDINYQELFSKILSSMEIKGYPAGRPASQGDKDQLRVDMYFTLYNNKYLIVLDDVWDIKVWDHVKNSFLNNKNGSRILLTTRISTLAKTVTTSRFVHEMKLIFVGVSFLPDEIWEMPELRHLWFTETDFPALPPSIPQNKALLLNLQTLSYINAASCTRDVLRSMPSLKKLSVWAEAPGVIGLYLDELQQLEAFKFTVLHPSPNKQVEFEPKISFPQTLRKLSLSGCGLPWDAMEVVAALPNLEVLKLRELAFNGKEWCLEDHCVFEELKFLLIEYLNFKRWIADESHFPCLERLHLRHCYELEKIPSDIGFIGSLKLIELVDCSPQAVESAEVIKQEQEVDYEKKDFQVRIYNSYV